MGDIDPGQRGNLQAFCCTAVGTVPEYIETIGPLPAFGHKTRGKGQHVLVAGCDDLADGGLVEADKIKVACTPSGKGFLMVRTLAAQIAKRHGAWQQEQQTHDVTQKFLLGFLGIV